MKVSRIALMVTNVIFLLIVLFDIVRSKNVSACLIQCCKTQKEYNSCPNITPLTQEEFNLAKEILG